MINLIIKYQVYIRVVLGVFVAWQVKLETGWWTFFFVLITLVSVELESENNRLRNELEKEKERSQNLNQRVKTTKNGFQSRLEKALKEQTRVKNKNKS